MCVCSIVRHKGCEDKATNREPHMQSVRQCTSRRLLSSSGKGRAKTFSSASLARSPGSETTQSLRVTHWASMRAACISTHTLCRFLHDNDVVAAQHWPLPVSTKKKEHCRTCANANSGHILQVRHICAVLAHLQLPVLFQLHC